MKLHAPSQEERIAELNRLYPVGTAVRYWTGARAGLGVISATRSRWELLGGHTIVVWVEGCSSCIAASHVEPLPVLANVGGALPKGA